MKKYKVLTYKQNKGPLLYDLKEDGNYHTRPPGYSSSFSAENNHFNYDDAIYSIKRLEDGAIFTIGDMTEFGSILRIRVLGDHTHQFSCKGKNGWIDLDSMKKTMLKNDMQYLRRQYNVHTGEPILTASEINNLNKIPIKIGTGIQEQIRNHSFYEQLDPEFMYPFSPEEAFNSFKREIYKILLIC